jgi:chemosensory pili system protein ChpA (sensor histidine kinase/response regulator)
MIVDLDDVGTIESGGVRRVKYRGVYLAVEELGTSLGMGAGQRGNAAVVVRMGEQRLAVCVDNIVGQDEIVVKGMGELLVDHPLFSGVTISGDGQLILIVDIPGLLASQRRRGNVDVPIAQEAAAPALPALAPAKGKERHGPGKDDERRGAIRVLYIDDSLSVRKAAEKLLKNLGVHVTLAIDGADGLEKVRQTVFDMVFTDLEMPRLNGYDMIRELRYVNNYKDVPVVVVTSRSGEKHRQQASVVGANDYVTKPFNQEVLEQKLAKWTRYRANA